MVRTCRGEEALDFGLKFLFPTTGAKEIVLDTLHCQAHFFIKQSSTAKLTTSIENH
jgi:hypothetical protein